MEEVICLNGSLLPRSRAKISVKDRGFLYGEGLFETLHVYNNKAVLLEDHLARLLKSAQYLNLSLPCSRKELVKLVENTIEVNRGSEGILRIILSGGCEKPQLLITYQHGLPYRQENYRKGISAVISSIRRNPYSPVTKIKSLSFLDNILAREEARQQGALEGIMLNVNGFVAEGTMSNFFLVKQEQVITPDLNSGILPGITRATVLRLAAALGLPVEERQVELGEIFEADECFLTNALMGVMPLVEVNGRKVGNGDAPGKITSLLLQQYRDKILS
ncbi:aminotransferase class IV [Calderihabitans maritimus]|uniref:Aminodeoxychorismate lyase n=1 Tax=Calderihabitans maritimus TaxID=1246530 RepID=A0A1Z5HPJ6_9FIRM|nr:aminotransferase class IV [Calderihabitans maritimus]GAW91307.1 aminodeoxychorismate lyase [Calderihabitans maritimus]